ncbi:glycerate kinase family protein [Pseudobacillus badius]|uniref:glycerate kinase family protein n=1 Tax=Bacillus badius TaxID=1455 RepID=UPI001CC1961E|nr:glycerate kinase [Bacillus badius]UAT30406.1 glycerate kinase [Bacillus badius]GLY09173.1 glycerate kinase [Bacillus badius]
MNILIAPDSFKGSLSAAAVGRAIAAGVKKAVPDAKIKVVPMADGGEGTIEALSGTRQQLSVHDPLMRPVEASYLTLEYRGEQTAVIECAQSSGLTLLPANRRSPMAANTYGLGEQIRAALDAGFRQIIISLGGSATNDGGLGMLQALGWKLYDQEKKEIPIDGNPLLSIDSFSDEDIHPSIRDTRFLAASDVMNSFYGQGGAAFVFAPQKGADRREVEELDRHLRKTAGLFQQAYGLDVQEIKGSGAAGGLGGAIAAALGGEIVSGVELVIQLTGLEADIRQADFIITGEGSLDGQSLLGKVPVGVARLAKLHGTSVIALAGRLGRELEALHPYFDGLFSIQSDCLSVEQAMEPETASRQASQTAEQLLRFYTLT